MGMYDIINYKCPYCGKETSTQTKLSSCELENLSIGDFFIVGDLRILMKNPCEYCNNKSIVIIENGIIKRFDKEEEGYNESELIFGIIEESKSQNGNKNEMKRKIEIDNYFYPYQKARALELVNKKLEKHSEIRKDVYEDVKKMIENLENPYPSDIWEGKTKEGKIGQFGNKVWENCKEELNKKLGEEKLTSQKDGERN